MDPKEVMEMRHRDRRDLRHSVARMMIAVLVFSLVGYAWFTLFARPVPDGNREVLIALVGAVTGALVTIVAFYFGDSDRH